MRTLLFALMIIGLSACASQDSPSVTRFDAPPIALTSLDNEAVSLEQFRGEAVVIHFGTSWCPFCRAEDPHLEALYQEYKKQGVQVLVVNVGETDEKAREWKDEAGFSFPMLMDRDGAISASYAPADAQPDLPRHEVMIASNLVVDAEGVVRFMSLLDTNDFDAKLIALRAQLDEILIEQNTYTSAD